jgi:hypothetical protein
VHQCQACNTAVALCLDAPLPQLCSFARWLPKHAQLLRSIAVTLPRLLPVTVGALPWEEHLEAAQQLLHTAVQLSAVPKTKAAVAAVTAAGSVAIAGGCSAAATAADAVGGQTQQEQEQQQQTQRSGCFDVASITFAGDAAILAAMPPHSLTHLDLSAGLTHSVDGPALSAALARLSNLQQLRLASATKYKNYIPGSCLAGVQQLNRLTSLVVDGCWSDIQQPLQQLLERPLQLQELQVLVTTADPSLALPDVAQLMQLSRLCSNLRLPDGAVLPTQLQELDLREVTSSGVTAISQLRQLTRLYLEVRFRFYPLLPLLVRQLPALQQLSLQYLYGASAADTAAAWAQLPQLCELHLDFSETHATPTRRQWDAITAGLPACTQLTKLWLDALVMDRVQVDGEYEVEAFRVAVCGCLAGLTRLQDFTLGLRSRVVPGDALELTALTGLTKLVLRCAEDGVDQEAAVGIARSLKQLRHLDLSRCDMYADKQFVKAVARLPQLTELQMRGSGWLRQEQLMKLTKLRQLQHLGCDWAPDVTDEAVESFWAAVRRQQ